MGSTSFSPTSEVRLDVFLSRMEPDYSRSIWQQHIRTGEVLVDDQPIRKPSHIVKPGSQVVVQSLPVVRIVQERQASPPLEVLYEDEAIIVLNKAAGVVVHPAHGHTSGGTIVDALIERIPTITEAIYDTEAEVSVRRPGIVHRIDRETSGVLLVAKTQPALRFLAKELIAHRFTKRYVAVVLGKITEEMVVDKPLGRHSRERTLMVVRSDGKPAQSRFLPCLQLDYQKQALSVIVAEPITGRTHQLRVHLKSISRPVIGDPVYCTTGSLAVSRELGVERQLLHAVFLRFRHPLTKKWLSLTAPLPKIFREVSDNTTLSQVFQCDEEVCKSMIEPFFKS